MVLGVICTVFGAGIWLINLYGNGFHWGRDWPFLLLVFGVYKIWDYTSRTRKKENEDLKTILKKVESGKMDAKEAYEKMEEK